MLFKYCNSDVVINADRVKERPQETHSCSWRGKVTVLLPATWCQC